MVLHLLVVYLYAYGLLLNGFHAFFLRDYVRCTSRRVVEGFKPPIP